MICPILTAIEIIDEAKAIFDTPAGKKVVVQKGVQQIKQGDEIRDVGSIVTYTTDKPNHHRFHALGPRIVMLRETTDCPPELVEAIDDMLVGMIRNRSLMRWKFTETPPRPIYSAEAMRRIEEMMESP